MTTILNISDAAALALHAMAYIASRQAGERASVGEMAETFGVSAAHLSKVLQRLTQLGFLESRRGPGGGFVLGKPAGSIRLLDLFEAMDGPVLRRACLLRHQVCAPGDCLLGDLVTEIQARTRAFLSETCLSAYAGREFVSPTAERGSPS